jgi:hypothetical protein
MKRIASILTGLSLAVLLFTAPVQAQYDGQRITSTVPFEFMIGNRSLPAGRYSFVRTGANAFLVRDADDHDLLTIMTGSIQANHPPAKTKLTFANVDGHHVLVQIWKEQEAIGSELYYGHSYVELAKHPAIHGPVAGRR